MEDVRISELNDKILKIDIYILIVHESSWTRMIFEIKTLMSKNYCWFLFTVDSKNFWNNLKSFSVYNWIEVKISFIVLSSSWIPQKPQTNSQFVCLEGNGKESAVLKVWKMGRVDEQPPNILKSQNISKKICKPQKNQNKT